MAMVRSSLVWPAAAAVLDHKDRKDPRGLLAQQGQQVHRAHRVLLDQTVPQDRKDHRVLLAGLGHRDPQDRKGHKGPLAQQALLAHRDHRVHKDPVMLTPQPAQPI